VGQKFVAAAARELEGDYFPVRQTQSGGGVPTGRDVRREGQGPREPELVG
jgi:hypothetical protein